MCSEDDDDESEYETDDSDEPPPPPPPKPKTIKEPKIDGDVEITQKVSVQNAAMTMSEFEESKPPPIPVVKSALTSDADCVKHQSLHAQFAEEQRGAESESEE